MVLASMSAALLMAVAVVATKVMTVRWLHHQQTAVREVAGQVRSAQDRLRLAHAEHESAKAIKLAVERRLVKLERQIRKAGKELQELTEEETRRASKIEQSERLLAR